MPADDNEYLGIINAARARLARGEPPAMLCIPYVCYSAGGDPCVNAPGVPSKKAGGDPCSGARGVKNLSEIRPHQDRTAPKGYASLEQMALVHLPIAIDKAMKIPEAKKAVDAEWAAHAQKGTWNAERVRPRAEVIAEAHAKKISVHFGRLMDLCHLKHAELEKRSAKIQGESRISRRSSQRRDGVSRCLYRTRSLSLADGSRKVPGYRC